MTGPTILCALLAFAALPALADPIAPANYAELAAELTKRIDFERLPRREEPGFNLDQPLYADGAWLGERFAGQTILTTQTGHDGIDAAPPPGTLQIAGGHPRQNLSIAFHRGFGSNALFPLGARSFPDIAARGEGAVAILFDHDQYALGFRVHTEYPDPLGLRPAPDRETLDILFLARDGSVLARLAISPGPGVSDHGFRRPDNQRDIAGVLILNNDPGGIAIDDIIFATPPLLG